MGVCALDTGNGLKGVASYQLSLVLTLHLHWNSSLCPMFTLVFY